MDVLMLRVILLSLLIILPFALSFIGFLICGDSWSWLLTWKTLCTEVGSGLLILMLQKVVLFHFFVEIALVLLICKWIKKINLLLMKLSFKMLGLLLLTLPLRKIAPWFILESFFHLRLCTVSTNLPSGLVWNTVAISGLVLLMITCI